MTSVPGVGQDISDEELRQQATPSASAIAARHINLLNTLNELTAIPLGPVSATMAPSTTLAPKLKVHLKMAIQRLRMVQQKDEAIAKQQRRAMAALLEQNKLESARIRVENIIRSDLTTELHEILELYCELLLARIGLLDNPPPASSTSTSNTRASTKDTAPSSHSPSYFTTPIDPALSESILSLVHAAPRTTIKELHQVRSLLIEKYGRDFGVKATEDAGKKVPERVRRKLSVEPPGMELVESYLRAIAGAYDVAYGSEDGGGDAGEDQGDDNPSDGQKALASQTPGIAAKSTNPTDLEIPLPTDLAPNTEPNPTQPPPSPPSRPPHHHPAMTSPIHVAPPSPRTEAPNPSVKLPGTPEGRVTKSKTTRTASGAGNFEKTNGDGASAKTGVKGGDGKKPEGAVPDVDDLEKRFALLKR